MSSRPARAKAPDLKAPAVDPKPPAAVGNDLVPSRRRVVPKGGYRAVRELLAKGGRESDAARLLGMSVPTFIRAKARDATLQAAVDAGSADFHATLVADLVNPQCEIPGLSVQQSIAVMKARSIRSMFLLKTRFGYQEHAPAEEGGKVTIEFKLPAALSADQYRATIEGETGGGNG